MQSFFRKAFGIYPNEKKMVFRFALLATLWSSASAIAETLTLGMFLEKIGTDRLPLVFLVIAACMIGVSSLFLYLLKFFTPEKIFMGVLSAAAVFYSLTACIVTSNSSIATWVVLQVFTTIFVSSMITTFWNLLDNYHDLQEAKRMYGIYNAACFFGTMLAGLLVNLAMDFTGPMALYFLVFVLTILSIIQIYSISKTISPVEDISSEDFFTSENKKISSLLRLFYKSPFALILVLASLIVQLLRTTTEFNYMSTFQDSFHNATSNTLPEFLGKLKAFVGLINIFFSLFFYRRFVRKLGLGQVILLPSIAFFFVYAEWSIFDSLLLAIFAFLALEAVLFNLNDSNNNLLINAAPSKLKGSLRIINDSFFEPIGMFLSSLFLLFLQKPYSIYFGLGLSIAFFIFYAFLRVLYPKSIFINLKQNLIHFERKIKDWFSLSSRNEQKALREDIFKALEDPSEDIRLLAYESILASFDPSLIHKLLLHVDNLSENRKISLLKLLEHSPYAQEPKILEQVNLWLESYPQTDLGKMCHFYLAKKGLLHPDKVKEDLDQPDLILRGAAIITLKNSLVNTILPNAALNRTIATKELDLLLKSTQEAEICMGMEILSVEKGIDPFSKTLELLSHDSTKVQRAAAKTLLLLADKKCSRFALKILEELKASPDNLFRLLCLEILGKINDSTLVTDILLASITFKPNEKRLAESIITKMGLKTVPVLISVIKNVQFHDRCRILSGKILGNLAMPQLRANLAEIMESEIDRAYFYFFYAHTIQQHYPLYDLNLLKNALITGFQSVIDFIVHLLGAAGSVEDCDLLVHTLHYPGTKSHADAIETLERNSNPKIFNKIRVLIDDIAIEDKLELCKEHQEGKPRLSLLELLNKLENSPSLFEKAVVAHLKAKFQMPNWQQSLKEQIKTNEHIFHQFAYELLEK